MTAATGDRTRRHSVGGVLLGSYLLVIAVVAGLGFVTVRYLTPELFDRRLRGSGAGGGAGTRGGQGGVGSNPFADSTAVSDSLDRSITIGAAVAAAAGTAVALLVAWLVTRSLVRRVSEMQEATARLAAGDHRVRVEEPPEAELADLARSINRLGVSLAATERTRARLISDLAHEIRNPLTTIQGSMEGLIDGVVPPTPETYGSVAEEADRLRRLTEDLSLLARGQEGALDLQLGPVDLLEVAGTTAERLRPQFEVKGVDLGVAGAAAPVTGDRDRLEQVLTNIVGNALTHTPAGGSVTVRVGAGSGMGPGSTAWVTVTDTGSGIPADQLETVFDRYTRLDHQRPGTGIGLNIARTLVTAHGGTIEARSEGTGTGSTFVIHLPAP